MKPRFTIRAILILMTLLAIFLGYHINWIHQRSAAIEDGWIAEVHNYWTPDDPHIAAPGLLGLFGQHGYGRLTVILSSDDDPLLSKAASLFPEASLNSWVGPVPPKNQRWPYRPWVN
ncbi:hypothetical protein [Lacipirellula limnantheis]|uniref:Uncharacterized protein n=1 Tax=Lacipirellula limnantheis TaxID=2528024 RepID=A0A517U5V3_9BACT|nr:hypothetical protein [Lacipirellula limnantheis]QDT76011.1 hypothetical protein I41_52560 [Lacipirellula limnantheis]